MLRIYGVLAVNLTIRLWSARFAEFWQPHFSLVPNDIHIFDLTISKSCCGSRKSNKSLLPEAFAWVSSFKMLLWPPRGSIFRRMQHYVYHCYHKHHQTTARISIKVGVRLFCLGSQYAFSFKNDIKYKLVWTVWFWLWSAIFSKS